MSTASNPSTEQPVVTLSNNTDIDFSQVKADRIELWRATIDAELQQHITEAAALRQKISESKTDVKRRYYNKKFKKVSDTVMQLLAVQSQLPPRESGATTDADIVAPTA